MKTLSLLSLYSIVLFCTSSPTQTEEKAKRIADFKDAVVMISRTFAPEEIIDPKFVGNTGTAWFFETRSHLITIEHVVREPDLSKDKWTEVWISQQNPDDEENIRVERCEVRLLQIIPSPKGEGLALLELRNSFKWGKVLHPETKETEKGEEVFSLGYPHGHLLYVSGTYHGLGEPDIQYVTRENMPLYELTDDIDRLSFNSGASGSPIINAKGNVIGVISTLFEQPYIVFGVDVKRGTAWGKPTHMATSTKTLIDFKFPD